MQFKRRQSAATFIALFLMLAVAASLVVLPSVSGITVLPERNTFIYVAAKPLSGVGQSTFIIYCIDRIPEDVGEQAQEIPSTTGRAGWDGIQLIITAPNETSETLNMPRTDPVGGGYYMYVPTQAGEYSVKAVFPGEWKNQSDGSTARWYQPSESQPTTFTVQTEPVAGFPEAPLPTQYWMRPISGSAHEWARLAYSALGGSSEVYPLGGSGGTIDSYSYGSAPESAHILWTRQYYPTGSIADTRLGTNVYTLNHYESVSYSTIIVDGQMHMAPAYSAHAEDQFGGWQTWDLYTGEQIAYRPDERQPEFATIYLYDSGNQHGAFDYLWRTTHSSRQQVREVQVPEVVRLANATPNDPIKRIPVYQGLQYYVNRTETPIELGQVWEMLDGYTGVTLCYIANVSDRGTRVYGSDGSIDFYNAVNLGTNANPNYRLQIWNSSAGTMIAYTTGTSAWQWRPQGMNRYPATRVFFNPIGDDIVHDGNLFFTLNVSIPNIQGPRNSIQNQTMSIRAVREGEYVIFGSTGSNDERGIVPARFMAVSLKEGQEGSMLWESTLTPPKDGSDWYGPVVFEEVVPEADVAYYSSENLLKYWFYDVKTGQLLWETDTIPEQFSYYGMQEQVYFGEHNMIILGGSHAGVLHAYDFRTGEVLWTAYGEVEGTDSPYGRALLRGFKVADGKLYTSVSEHSGSSPLWLAPGLHCFDIETGELIWKILFWGSGDEIADGIYTSWNLYDGQVYAFGKGPSATTVTAPDVSMSLGSKVLIKGTVTDQTPTGRRNVNNLLEFSLKDTPAIADEYMSAWMEYLFMGQEFPAEATGVNVTLTIIDPNGNIEVGSATSDVTGAFCFDYEPPVPGMYNIIADFVGSASYYGSSATTCLIVEEAAAATPPPTPSPASTADLYLVPSTVGVIIAIAAVGVILFLQLRKR